MKIERADTLLKVTFEDGVIGYSDLHVWESLGDPSLVETYSSIYDNPNDLAKSALQCARLDGVARSEGKSLFEGLVVPQSHYFYREGDSLDAIAAAGFTTVKVKVSPDTSLEMFKGCKLTLRLDANNQFSKRTFEEWFDDELAPQIEFIEDPYPQDESWSCAPVPFAVDRQLSDKGACVQIFKPALSGMDYNGSLPVVVTGYLGHSFGDAYAAYVAGKLKIEGKEVLTCGLMSSSKQDSPDYTAKKGLGLGFDSYLKSLSWREL